MTRCGGAGERRACAIHTSWCVLAVLVLFFEHLTACREHLAFTALLCSAKQLGSGALRGGMDRKPHSADNELLRELARQREERKRGLEGDADSTKGGRVRHSSDEDIILVGDEDDVGGQGARRKADSVEWRKRKELEDADMALAARLQREEEESLALAGSQGASAGGAWDSAAASASGWGAPSSGWLGAETGGSGAWASTAAAEGDPSLVDEQVSRSSPGACHTYTWRKDHSSRPAGVPDRLRMHGDAG